MPATVSKILACYLFQSYLLKRSIYYAPHHWYFSGKFMNFLGELENTASVLTLLISSNNSLTSYAQLSYQ